MAKRPAQSPPVTPDGRYILVRGRLWRHANPSLPEAVRQALVDELQAARRAIARANRAGDDARPARRQVDAAKRALGERGPPWWNDGAPDYGRRMAANTPYSAWAESLPVPVTKR